MQYLNNLDVGSDNHSKAMKQEMMNADSPIHSEMEFEHGESSIDEFKDLKDAKDYKGVQQRPQ